MNILSERGPSTNEGLAGLLASSPILEVELDCSSLLIKLDQQYSLEVYAELDANGRPVLLVAHHTHSRD